MKLSILILTHNRPKLFQRCISSVLSQIKDNVEVIVNNDSNDITEIEHPQVQYFYKKFDNLSSIYEFLYSKSTGDYVYFLEDDDYLRARFFEEPLDADIIAGNYYPCYDTKDVFDISTQFSTEDFGPRDFIKKLNLEHLQLGQFIFKRQVIHDFEFYPNNNIYNDIRLVLHAARNSKYIRTVNKILFYQTIDGGDNISFPESNHSLNTTQSLDFLEKYGLQTPTPHTARP